MGFFIAESNSDGTINLATQRLLQPGPTTVDYGDRFPYSIQETHGSGVRQRLKKNPKEMKWVWADYNPNVPRYENQYWDLFQQQSHVRVKNGASPYVWLREDVTTNWGKYDLATNRIESDWIRVLITFVGRDNTAGGNVRYPSTEVRFVMADASVTDID